MCRLALYWTQQVERFQVIGTNLPTISDYGR